LRNDCVFRIIYYEKNNNIIIWKIMIWPEKKNLFSKKKSCVLFFDEFIWINEILWGKFHKKKWISNSTIYNATSINISETCFLCKILLTCQKESINTMRMIWSCLSRDNMLRLLGIACQTSLTRLMTWFGDLRLSLSAKKSEIMVCFPGNMKIPRFRCGSVRLHFKMSLNLNILE
jgi:hypothetical protein